MKFEIKNWSSGALIFSIETDSWKLAIEAAVKANADLRYADLNHADLRSANLRYANLRSAKGYTSNWFTPLRILLDQPGKIRAYKLVTDKGIGPFNGGITYEIGKSYSVKDALIDEFQDCGPGINVATLDWCLRNWRPSYKVFIVEFKAEDIACIPVETDGKFRLHRCKVVGKKDIQADIDCLTKKEEVKK